MKLRLVIAAASIALAQSAYAQPENWFNLDPKTDNVPGISTEKAYNELLKNRAPKTIIVAVLDSGVDPEHEDLKSVMWVNEDEVAGDGIDNDKNGYVDDIHGWNFIGGAGGKNVHQDQLEVTRLYVMYKAKFGDKKAEDVSKKEKAEFERWEGIKKKVEKQQKESKANIANITGLQQKFTAASDLIRQATGQKEVTFETLAAFEPKNDEQKEAVGVLKNFVQEGGKDTDFRERLEKYLEYLNNQVQYHYNPDFNPRGVVGDDYLNVAQRNYGNNDVQGPDAFHGTHVAGIIGAARNNGVGMNGVSNAVRIMSVRCVPDGDERDKDVANAIRYAVDNGAKVINMSFGKNYAFNKPAVDAAFKYAEKKGVLLVHAAGNDSYDVDVTDVFPTPYLGATKGKKRVKNVLTVGAANWEGGEAICAEFTNFGQKDVDVFAPGVDIYSTIPGSVYDNASGTSMAAPVVAGLAALVWSYYPDFTAVQIKDIIMTSAIRNNEEVIKPGTEDEMVNFSTLSVSGAMVNAVEALKLAEQRYKK